MSCASVGLICVSVLGTSIPPCSFPLLLLPLSLPPAVLIPISLSYALFFSLFFLHTRKNQEKKGLIMVTSKLVVRLPPPSLHLHTPSPLTAFAGQGRTQKVEKWMVSFALLLVVVVCPFGLLLLLLISLFIYIQIFCSLFFFHSSFFSSTHFLSLRSSSFLFARNFRC